MGPNIACSVSEKPELLYGKDLVKEGLPNELTSERRFG